MHNIIGSSPEWNNLTFYKYLVLYRGQFACNGVPFCGCFERFPRIWYFTLVGVDMISILTGHLR